MELFLACHRAFYDLDASLLEINPLVVTRQGEVMALDGKMSFDDNALYRHRDIEELRDEDEIDPLEKEAARHDLNYVKLDGNIGLVVNGAGLSMATMDILRHYGGAAANFLDVAGAATPERVAAAFRLINADPDVRGILVNIFGGMMRCDSIAEGLVTAAREVELDKPLVVRLEGTNVDEGQDRQGFIAKFTALLVKHGANIVRVNAGKVEGATGDQYIAVFAISLRDERAPDCLAAIVHTAGELKLSFRYETA